MTFHVTDVTTGRAREVRVDRLVIAGFTGRDAAGVAEHVEELRALGVPVPESTPSFYVLDPALLTVAGQMHVEGTFTSGEVEPVVLLTDDGALLGVGSDHTDRELEATSIADSKAACPKPIAEEVVPVDAVADWDAVTITSHADGEAYQSGRLGDLLPFDDVHAAARAAGIDLGPGDVIFLGTVPVIGELRPAARFEATLDAGGHTLRLAYSIDGPTAQQGAMS